MEKLTVDKSRPIGLAECQTFTVGDNGLLVEQDPSSDTSFAVESVQDFNLLLVLPSFRHDVIFFSLILHLVQI